MKVLLGLIGLAALAFGGMHVLGLISDMNSGAGIGQFGPTRLLAHVVGVAFGLLVAIVCFRKCAGRANAPAAGSED